MISCLRLQSLVKFANSPNPTCELQHTDSVLFHLLTVSGVDDNAPAVFWSIAECDIAITSSCMPFLPSLLQHFFPSVFGELEAEDQGSPRSKRSQCESVSMDSMAKGVTKTWVQGNGQA